MSHRLGSYFTGNGVPGLCRSHAVWGDFGDHISPLFYLRRPKWIKDDESWQRIVASVRLDLPKGTEIG